jgi:rRNA processing protein Krr1/Pno1
MNDLVNHPAHYESGYTAEIECIDVAQHLTFCRGNAFKYVWRCGKKGDSLKAIEDLKKALWYIQYERCHIFGASSGISIALNVLNLIKPEEGMPMFEKMRLRALLAIVHSDGADTAVTKMIAVLEGKESDGKA